MRTLYSISIFVYQIIIRLASAFNSKAKLWLEGRKGIFEKLTAQLSNSAPEDKIAWFHCASLGEFEQGRPLIEKYKIHHPGTKILLTFFSPSGYEIRKNYPGADFIFYLPADTLSNAKRFIDIVNPAVVFFVKYEFWFHYLYELKKRNIPVYLVSGIFRKEQHFFKSYGGWFRKQLGSFSHFYLQDEQSIALLNSIGYKNTTLAGDTRFDRVWEIAKNTKPFPLIEKFRENSSVLIAGSSWREDEKIISVLQPGDFKLIIAPHEIDEKHIDNIENQFAGFSTLRYSKATESNVSSAQVLIIDNIGMLSSLYRYAEIAFIGGGFGKGIHNILEAATFGLPVIFGPNYEKFTEAKELIRLGGAFSVTDQEEFTKTILLLKDPQVLQTASHISKHYVGSRVGATDRILSTIV